MRKEIICLCTYLHFKVVISRNVFQVRVNVSFLYTVLYQCTFEKQTIFLNWIKNYPILAYQSDGNTNELMHDVE